MALSSNRAPVLAASVALLLSGCSSASPSGGFGPEGSDAGVVAADAAVSAPNATSDGSTAIPDGGPTTSGADGAVLHPSPDAGDAEGRPENDAAVEAGPADAGGDSTAGPPDTRLLPFAVGRSWTYDITSTYATCPSGMHSWDVLGTSTMNGETAYDTTSPCGFEGTYTENGDVVEDQFGSSNGTWLRDLDTPVADGHSWTTTNGEATFTMTYSDAGTVTVPAGTFSDCWTVTQGVSYTQTWTYCRGVGQVASVLVDLADGGISYQLVSKNF